VSVAESRIVVVGASEHAKVVIDVLEKEGKHRIVGLIDTHKPAGESVFGYQILGDESRFAALATAGEIAGGIIAIGANWTRHLVARKIQALVPGFRFVTAIHPSAQLARGVTIGAGSVLMAGVVVNSDSRIGACCILNTASSLDHDSVMGDFSSLAPRASTGGCVTIGEFSAISLGAGIIHGKTIGPHSVLGAGAMAVEDLPDHAVAFGVPARVIRARKEDEKYL
jgi:sugar O-acyltransferase (sialic acid O-acetyltransferase NeuD family)